MFDILQVIFWSITYVLVIVSGFKSAKLKMVSMPYVAGVLNFSWEIVAVKYSGGLWSHVLWVGLDLFIVFIGYRFLENQKSKMMYLGSIIALVTCLFFVFKQQGGQLFSVFAIDLIMAVCFLVQIEKMSPYCKIPIAVTKLMGDTFAGLFYAKDMKAVAVMAVIVFICNVTYLFLCIKEYKITDKNAYYKIQKKKKKRK